VLELNAVTKGYDEGEQRHAVLKQVDLRLAPGEYVALRGESGSGKSTLLQVIAGLDAPDSGEVRLQGQVLSALNETARTLLRRRQIGFVYQFFNLIPTLTVAENLRLPLALNKQGQAAAKIDAMLAELGLAGYAQRFPDRLSGGEQQRVAIARALIHRPALVLADEPTGSLDAASGERVLNALRKLVREQHVTLLLATHSAQVAAEADRVIYLADGQLTPAAPREPAA